MNSLFALTIVFVIYAIGDIVSTKTHAIVSMLLIISVIFALAFWNNWLPGTIFTDSNLKAFGDVTVGLLLVHMGTTIRIRDFIEQYKTVIIVLCSTLAICIGVYFISRSSSSVNSRSLRPRCRLRDRLHPRWQDLPRELVPLLRDEHHGAVRLPWYGYRPDGGHEGRR